MRLSSVWYTQLALSLWGYTDDSEERIPAVKEHTICSAKTGMAILLVPDHFTSSFRFTQPRLPPGFHGYVMDSLADTAIVWLLPPAAVLPLCLSSSVGATVSTEAGALGLLEAQIWLDQTHRGADFSSAFGLRGSMALLAVKWLLPQLPKGWDIITQKWMGGWHW